MKKTILLFAVLAIMAPIAFAADHAPYEDPAMCSWRTAEGLPGLTYCEYLIQHGQPLTRKCCWANPLCANYGDGVPTCESLVEAGQIYPASHWCCWNSRENISLGGDKSGNDKGGKKTHVQAPKGKQGAKVQPVKANTAKAPAQAKVQVQKKTVAKK